MMRMMLDIARSWINSNKKQLQCNEFLLSNKHTLFSERRSYSSILSVLIVLCAAKWLQLH